MGVSQTDESSLPKMNSMIEESGNLETYRSTATSKRLNITDYEMQGILGEGSYGKVYLAKEKTSGKKFAIKVLDKYHIMKVHLC